MEYKLRRYSRSTIRFTTVFAVNKIDSDCIFLNEFPPL